MTTVTRTQLKCPKCGHTGNIKMKENDAPFSRQYEDYTLEGLDGKSFSTTLAQWPEVFQQMKPACPSCKTALTEADIA